MTETCEILIAGGGIAGLSAGLAAARLGRKTVILTGDTLGGHLLTIEAIDGYPGYADGIAGYDLCPIVQEQAMAEGAELAMTSVRRIERGNGAWRVDTGNGAYEAGSLIIATGTRLKTLDVPGESLLRGKGVSQCASCDAPLLKGRAAVVAGGGDSALQEALTLAVHCSEVTIVHHGATASAQAAYLSKAQAAANIAFRPESEVAEIVGEAAVEAVRIASVDAAETDSIECAGVFVFVGLQPSTDFIDDAGMLASNGSVLTDPQLRTLHPGLLAAGTVRSAGIGRAAAASGDGTAAAIEADRYLRSGYWIEGKE